MFLALSSLYHAIYKANVDVPLPSLLEKKKKKKKKMKKGMDKELVDADRVRVVTQRMSQILRRTSLSLVRAKRSC